MQKMAAEHLQGGIDEAIVYCLEPEALQRGRLPGCGPVYSRGGTVSKGF